jgi:hypothetical protein
MNFVQIGFLFVVMFQVATGAFGSRTNSDRDEIYTDISSIFENYYAPKEWKSAHFAWDLDTELAKLKEATTTNEIQDFHKALKSFFVSLRDYHSSILFTDNGKSTLPISIKYIAGKFYVSYISPTYGDCMLLPGDEIVKINGVDVEGLALGLIGNIANPSLTDWALSALKLTNRTGAVGDPVEKGPVVIEAKRGPQMVEAQLVWQNVENTIGPHKGQSLSNFKYNESLGVTLEKKIGGLMENIESHVAAVSYRLQLSDFLRTNPLQQVNNPMALGKKESFLPKLGEQIWWQADADNPFEAYIYEDEEKNKIGFIRIANYSPDEAIGDANFHMNKFGEIINLMNKKTDILVIDQLNNPGGNALYLYSLASALTQKQLRTPRHQFSIDSKDIFEAQKMQEEIEFLVPLMELVQGQKIGSMFGYPLDMKFIYHLQSYYQFIIDQYEQEKYLTDPYFLHGVDFIYPSSTYQYTKPILLLINELDFSGGDFFPEIMRQSDKVTLMGTTTAGAGGYVLAKAERNRSGILGYSYTGSLAIKSDNLPLENLGVPPHIEYVMSPLDLMYGFLVYKQAINDTVKSILKK